MEASGSRWKYRWKHAGVYGNPWKLSPNMVVEASVHGSIGIFYFYRHLLPWKLPSSSMEVNMLPSRPWK